MHFLRNKTVALRTCLACKEFILLLFSLNQPNFQDMDHFTHISESLSHAEELKCRDASCLRLLLSIAGSMLAIIQESSQSESDGRGAAY